MDSNEAPPADTNEIKISPESTNFSDATEPKSEKTPEIINILNLSPEAKILAFKTALEHFKNNYILFQGLVNSVPPGLALVWENFHTLETLIPGPQQQILPNQLAEEEQEEEEEFDFGDTLINSHERMRLFKIDVILHNYLENYHQNNKAYWRSLLNKNNIRRINQILGTDMNINDMSEYLTNHIHDHPSAMSNDIEKAAEMIREWNRRDAQ